MLFSKADRTIPSQNREFRHMTANLLAAETSPYLLQHRDNPVHWQPWGSGAFDLARATGRPVLLSVGYAACHWCHVMAHECFEDPDIADLMNRLFINIKVDREERPDVDQIYQHALALLGQQGGWPLTMFLTPDAQPFWGGTYFPPASRWGRPGFPDVLHGVSQTWLSDQGRVSRNVGALADALKRLSEHRPGPSFNIAALDQVAGRLIGEVDPVHGGIGGAPKFPQPGIFEMLWRAWLRSGHTGYATAVTTTLTAMAQGGIYDHLGGGFARYSTDSEWLAPHFEKMLYDNAQLIELMTLVWLDTADPLLQSRIAETVGWLQREMIADGGGFAATLDADSEGVEGKFYVWDAETIARLLGPRAPAFAATYGVTTAGNWEHTNILTRRNPQGGFDPATEPALAEDRAVLLAERGKRIRPGWDDKVLADWNGLAIAALAKAGTVFEQPTWLDVARRAFHFVCTHMQRDGRLLHSWRAGQLKHRANLDDYANMARAALALYEIDGDPTLLDQAVLWVKVCQVHFQAEDSGGFYCTPDDADDLIVRVRQVFDNAVPSGNGTLLGVLARLWLQTGEDQWRRDADALLQAFGGELTRNVFPLSTYLNNAELLLSPLQVVLIGEPDDPATLALSRSLYRQSLPTLVVTRLKPNQALHSGHPAHGKGLKDGQPTAYVCRDLTCSPPVTEPDALTALLRRPQ